MGIPKAVGPEPPGVAKENRMPLIACPLCGSIWELDADQAKRADHACEGCGTNIMTRGDEAKHCKKCNLIFGAKLGKCPGCGRPASSCESCG